MTVTIASYRDLIESLESPGLTEKKLTLLLEQMEECTVFANFFTEFSIPVIISNDEWKIIVTMSSILKNFSSHLQTVLASLYFVSAVHKLIRNINYADSCQIMKIEEMNEIIKEYYQLLDLFYNCLISHRPLGPWIKDFLDINLKRSHLLSKGLSSLLNLCTIVEDSVLINSSWKIIIRIISQTPLEYFKTREDLFIYIINELFSKIFYHCTNVLRQLAPHTHRNNLANDNVIMHFSKDLVFLKFYVGHWLLLLRCDRFASILFTDTKTTVILVITMTIELTLLQQGLWIEKYHLFVDFPSYYFEYMSSEKDKSSLISCLNSLISWLLLFPPQVVHEDSLTLALKDLFNDLYNENLLLHVKIGLIESLLKYSFLIENCWPSLKGVLPFVISQAGLSSLTHDFYQSLINIANTLLVSSLTRGCFQVMIEQLLAYFTQNATLWQSAIITETLILFFEHDSSNRYLDLKLLLMDYFLHLLMSLESNTVEFLIVKRTIRSFLFILLSSKNDKIISVVLKTHFLDESSLSLKKLLFLLCSPLSLIPLYKKIFDSFIDRIMTFIEKFAWSNNINNEDLFFLTLILDSLVNYLREIRYQSDSNDGKIAASTMPVVHKIYVWINNMFERNVFPLKDEIINRVVKICTSLIPLLHIEENKMIFNKVILFHSNHQLLFSSYLSSYYCFSFVMCLENMDLPESFQSQLLSLMVMPQEKNNPGIFIFLQLLMLKNKNHLAYDTLFGKDEEIRSKLKHFCQNLIKYKSQQNILKTIEQDGPQYCIHFSSRDIFNQNTINERDLQNSSLVHVGPIAGDNQMNSDISDEKMDRNQMLEMIDFIKYQFEKDPKGNAWIRDNIFEIFK